MRTIGKKRVRFKVDRWNGMETGKVTRFRYNLNSNYNLNNDQQRRGWRGAPGLGKTTITVPRSILLNPGKTQVLPVVPPTVPLNDYLVLIWNHTKPGTALIETVLTGDPLYILPVIVNVMLSSIWAPSGSSNLISISWTHASIPYKFKISNFKPTGRVFDTFTTL